MVLDREIQLAMMRKMQIVYPSYYDFDTDYPDGHQDREKALKNLYYLRAHKLVEAKSIIISEYLDGDMVLNFGASTLTHDGMDFLADDGGLSAILGVVTVRFEADTIRAILQLKVDQSDLSPVDKQRLHGVLQELPAESIKHLTTKIVDTGWDGLGSLMNLIQSSLF